MNNNKQIPKADTQNTSLGQLVLSPVNRFNPDIAKWRMALRAAENRYSPMRTMLYDVYEETMLDGMITSVTERLAIKCQTSKIVFVKENAQEDNPISKMLETPEFLDFIKYIIEAKWWGHSLIEFEFEDEKIAKINLIPRKNIIPEKGLFVKQVGQASGILYREQPYSDYLVEVGSERDLGLLNKATPYAIYKRMGLANWGEFIELFGVPIRQFEYDSNNPNARKEVEKQAEKHGASATIIMPQGTKMNVIKGGDGSGNSAVFKDYKKVNDEEILLIFLLQTMTTLDGSSRSQGEVHERSEGDLVNAYKLFVELVLNYKFLPLLAKHGFDVEGGKLKYDDKRELSKKEWLDIIKGLAQFGDVPLDFIEQHFGIKLTPKQKQAVQKALKLKMERYGHCTHNHSFFAGDEVTLNNIDNEERKMLRRIYNQGGKAKFDYRYLDAISAYLIPGINAGFADRKNIDYDSPDHLAKTLLELNVTQFSATKDAALVEQLNTLLSDTESFNEFQKQASTILDQYNANWLQSEYELAQSTALGTANYLRNLEVAEDFPYWEYSTANDERVREEHQALNGLMFKAGEMGIFTPPNGWGCRCDVIPRASLSGKSITDENQAIERIGDEEYKKMRKQGFTINRASQAVVFTDRQLYQTDLDLETLSFADFGLKQYDKIKSKAPKSKVKNRNEQEVKEWFDERLGQYGAKGKKDIRLIDYKNRPLKLSLSTLQASDNNVLDMLETTLSKPDEVYMNKQGKSYLMRYIKHYNPNPMVVEVLIKASSKSPIITDYYLSKNPDRNDRKGVIFFKK